VPSTVLPLHRLIYSAGTCVGRKSFPSFKAGKQIKGVKQLVLPTADGTQLPALPPHHPAQSCGRVLVPDAESELGGQFGSWRAPCIFKHH
jgi:hypothetical protein